MFRWQWTSTGLVYPQVSTSVTFMNTWALKLHLTQSHRMFFPFPLWPWKESQSWGNAIHKIWMVMLQMLGKWVHCSQLHRNLCGRTPWWKSCSGLSSGPICTGFQFSPGWSRCFPPTEDWKHRLEVCLVEELLMFINSSKKKELASWQWERNLKRMKTQHRNQ